MFNIIGHHHYGNIICNRYLFLTKMLISKDLPTIQIYYLTHLIKYNVHFLTLVGEELMQNVI